VLHRDLSSQNILLTSDNHIKIADFGCARKVNDRGEYKSTSITGSPAYMAPEQLEGHVLTLKADMWAVGVNLWEVRDRSHDSSFFASFHVSVRDLCIPWQLATQKLPWAEEAMRESANGLADYEYCRRKVRNNGKLSRPSSGQLNSSVADGYMQIIQSCHNKDPSKRPSSHDAFSS
jgi:serine/threonine protein kinase